MSLGLHERQQKARRRTWWILLIGLIAAMVAFLLISYAFQTGRELAKIDIRRLDDRIAELQAAIKTLEGEKQQLANATKAADDRAKEWERKYDLGVPNGISKELFDQMQAQLQKGVPADRMALFIGQASKPRSCDPAPESIQLYVRTGIGKPGGKFETTFGGHRLTVTMNGDPAVNKDGQKEAWFDTEKPITVTFTDPVGQSWDMSGLLPLKRQMVVGDSEFQIDFAIEDKRRGYVAVTSARCNFP
jgi:outer membrane murein-binding lipoprotein Lpp